MMDIKRYSRLRPSGLTRIEKTDDCNFVVMFKRFDNETGQELSPEPNYVNLPDMEKEAENLGLDLICLNLLIDDIKKL